MTARQFGRDTGDIYGRHALVNPGGDNVQRDVLHVIDHWIHPTLIADNYVGAHRIRDGFHYVHIVARSGHVLRTAANR